MKKMLLLALTASFILSGTVFAAKFNCTVDAVEGNKVTLTCEDPGEAKKAKKGKKDSTAAIIVGEKAKLSIDKKLEIDPGRC